MSKYYSHDYISHKLSNLLCYLDSLIFVITSNRTFRPFTFTKFRTTASWTILANRLLLTGKEVKYIYHSKSSCTATISNQLFSIDQLDYWFIQFVLFYLNYWSCTLVLRWYQLSVPSVWYNGCSFVLKRSRLYWDLGISSSRGLRNYCLKLINLIVDH